MSDLRSLKGFEEALRPPVDVRRARLTSAVLQTGSTRTRAEVIAQLDRVARRVPEVMVKVTGRTRDGGHLKAHLEYISRNGALELEGPDDERLGGLRVVRDLAQAWADEHAADPRRRRDTPVSVSVVLSMPAGTDPLRVRDAARAVARELFDNRFPYVFALHDEGRNPHVHLAIRNLGRDGERLNPRKADLQVWRERFAHHLRARGIEAEATPRRVRAVVRKAERTPVRKLRERFEQGRGAAPKVLTSALANALRPHDETPPWREPILRRQAFVRRRFEVEAIALARSDRAAERVLARVIVASLQRWPSPETRHEQLVRRVSDKGDRRPEAERGKAR